ncbi:hypothetical protein GCM10010345_85640 [Streptomyces canarius]|uniref:Uncharacterized protein n=1 Tax=Streptomyces canarius TaxID=285453 RepID=A0ABQ3DB71_9ACTN|nr:hypothetical protein GCM10010345_85640 [Streptomyces canarius]
MGGGLLRRIALFHAVTAFYRVQCWDDGDSWKIDARTAHPRARWHDQLLQRLCHPRWALPLRVAHRFCRYAEPDTPYQWNHTCDFYSDGHTTGNDDSDPRTDQPPTTSPDPALTHPAQPPQPTEVTGIAHRPARRGDAFTSRRGGTYGLWVTQSSSAGQRCAQSGGSVSL